MAQWVLGVKVLSGSKGRKFKPRPSRDFFAFFQKSSKFFIKTTFIGIKNHEEHESGVKKIPTLRKIL